MALASGLISLFILGYSHPGDTEGKSERAGNPIREIMLTTSGQWVVIVASAGLLIVEFIGIATNKLIIWVAVLAHIFWWITPK